MVSPIQPLPGLDKHDQCRGAEPLAGGHEGPEPPVSAGDGASILVHCGKGRCLHQSSASAEVSRIPFALFPLLVFYFLLDMVVEPPLLLLIAIARAKKPKDQAEIPLGIRRHTKAPHAFGYRGRLLAAYYHICDRQADGTFIGEEEVQKKLVTNYPAFRKSRDAGHIYTTKGARQAAPRLFKNRRDEKGRFRKAFAWKQGQELSKYGIKKTLLQTYDMNKASKSWLAGADEHQKSRLSKVRERAIGVQMDAVRQRVKMQEEVALIGRELQDAQQRLAEAEEMEETLKREKEEFEREKAAFRATTGGNIGTISTHGIGTKHVAGGSTSTSNISSEVGDDIMGGRIKRRHKDRSQRQHLCSRGADLRDPPARPPP